MEKTKWRFDRINEKATGGKLRVMSREWITLYSEFGVMILVPQYEMMEILKNFHTQKIQRIVRKLMNLILWIFAIYLGFVLIGNERLLLQVLCYSMKNRMSVTKGLLVVMTDAPSHRNFGSLRPKCCGPNSGPFLVIRSLVSPQRSPLSGHNYARAASDSGLQNLYSCREA